jgi:hypothetical protein
VIISSHQGSDPQNQSPYVSVTHRRSEMVLATIDKKFQEVFAFQWELQCQFTGMDCYDICCFKAKLLGFDWTNSPKKDLPIEDQTALEKNIKNVFEELTIVNTIMKKKEIKVTPNDSTVKLKKGAGGFFTSVTEDDQY